MSNNYNIGDEIEVRIEKIVPRGFGLAFGEKLTLLVPLAAPGDVVRVRIRDIKKRLAFADIVEIKQPGPNRIVPPCPYFGTCGGCDFQQMDYDAQLAAKAGIIRDCLHRIGKIEYAGEIPVIPSPSEFAYRSRARWHLDAGKKTVGYFRRDSNDVIDIAECPILALDMETTLGGLRKSVHWEMMLDEKPQIEAASGDDGTVSIFSREISQPPARIGVQAAGESYEYSAKTFFQANRFMIDKLVETAIGDATGGTAFDLYCGVGLFSLPLARHFKWVIGVEESAVAIDFAKRNAKNAGIRNLDFTNRSVEQFLLTNRTKQIDLALIDPPRSGTEKQTIHQLAALKPRQISYVSCEPSILARDLRILLDAGYSIDSITALDLFPQTHHVETVVRLRVS